MNFTFKRLEERDIVLLYAWSKQPILLKFWTFPTTREAFNEKYRTKITDPSQQPFMVYNNDEPFGYIQSYAVSKDDPLRTDLNLRGVVYGIDQFIGNSAFWGKGLGPIFIRQFIEKLFTENPTLSTLIVDPLSSNERAIKCYEKVGFKLIREIPSADGPKEFMGITHLQ